jgi:hypothetical protein
MAYEQTGPGYSSGMQPQYAQYFNQLQQQNAQQFADYTNPFLNERGVQSEILPWQQQALENQREGLAEKTQAQQAQYQQGILGVEQARQQMAQTAQNALLPLQANMLGVQADGISAETAARNFQLGKQQQAFTQAPRLFSSLSDAVTKGDPSAIYQAMSENPAAAMTYGQDTMNALNFADKSQQMRNAGMVGSAQQIGMDDAAKNISTDPTEYASGLTQQSGETDSQYQMRKAAQMGGFAQKQQQMMGVRAQAVNAQALATIRAGGTIKAAELRTMGQAIRNGTMTVEQLESISPGLGNAALNDPDEDFKGDPAAAAAPVFNAPEPIIKDLLDQRAKLPTGDDPASQATRAQNDAAIAWAAPQMAKSMGISSDPNVSRQLQTINLQMKPWQQILSNSANDPKLMQRPTNMWGTPTGEPSPYEQAVQKLNVLQQQQQQILGAVGQSAVQPDQADQTNLTSQNFSNSTNGWLNGAYIQGTSIPLPAGSPPPGPAQPIQYDPSTNRVNTNLGVLAASGSPATATAMAQNPNMANPAQMGLTATPGQRATAQRSVVRAATPQAQTQKPAQKSFPQPRPEDVAYLAQNRSPVTIQRFEQNFGPGSAMKALQAFASTTPKNPATAVPVQ